MADYTDFRRRLDAVLSTLDVKQVTDFLIAEKQWDKGTPADAEFAMWTMIAGSPTLAHLHTKAREWLLSHGHEEEAAILLAKEQKKNKPQKKGGSPTYNGKRSKPGKQNRK